jgi:radical SAM protein with 4Fe4S-binding SPASM domain
MSNIAITNICNLQCKYCFADDMIQEESQFMDFATFQRVLHFLAQESPTRVGIIGGEPTLHPQFDLFLDELIDFCYNTESGGLIFTNGINLKPYLPKIIDNKISVLVNCNSPEFQTQEQYQALLGTLDECQEFIESDLIRCGCNIYLECTDYSFFWNDIVDRYHPPIVRASLVSPGKCYSQWNKQDKKEEYYKQLKPFMIDFIKEAKKRNVQICFDCNQIPICMLTPEEKEMLVSVASKFPPLQCDGGLDIDMNLQAFNCFSTYEYRVDIEKFNSPQDVRNYLNMEYLHTLMINNKEGMCQKCEKGALHICQGGCLSFSKGGK